MDIAVGAPTFSVGCTQCGAVAIVYLNTDGSAKSHFVIANNASGLPAGLIRDNERFGRSLALPGDMDSE
jgi:hypothetical protein